jgi:hypothetical protein
MADPIDDLEAMIAEALDAADAGGFMDEVRGSIQRWRSQFGGDEIYVAKRAAIARHARILELMGKGLNSDQISQSVGASVRQVQRVKKKASSYL